jgi:hypothetical protein
MPMGDPAAHVAGSAKAGGAGAGRDRARRSQLARFTPWLAPVDRVGGGE